MSFTPIETQEAFDEAIKERLKRAEESVRKEYEGFLSQKEVEEKYSGYIHEDEIKKKYEGYLSPEEVAKKDAQIKAYETDSVKTRVALAAGLPYDMVHRVQGDDEASMKEDAEKLAGYLKPSGSEPPLRSTEPNGSTGNKAALKGMLDSLEGE